MKGYQVSQYDTPIGHHGWLTIYTDSQKRRVGITRVHLEEDVAKLLHRTSPAGEAYSLVDVNRSGVPLMEIVGEPDLRSPEEAREYLVKLRSILRYLGVSTANMEEGSFRCDANISIRPEGSTELLAKVEVKNMNSFKAVYRALEYEVQRQKEAAAGGKRIVQETRGWVDDKGKTVSQRSKEDAHDYRYFPEPDLPPLEISRDWVEKVGASIPELPEARRDRFMTEFGLSLYDANLLTGSKAMADYFEDSQKTQAYKKLPPDEAAKALSNWLLGEVSRIINANNMGITDFRKKVSPEELIKLAVLNSQGDVSTTTSKSILVEMFNTGKDADAIIAQQGLKQISDTTEIEEVMNQVFEANLKAVADYKAGKAESLKFLLGQVMRATRGRANPTLAAQLLKKKLGEEG
jgi:aspartyl-tRNA(Asn)/glutamyl-tRNA(Gln) amidotransferase subunit B